MDEEITNSNNILVDLDALMDTRLGLLFSLDQDLVGSIVKDKSYHNRVKDNFGYISNDIFTPLYRKRKKGILSLATPTPIFSIVREQFMEVVTDHKNTEDVNKAKIFINTYPYKLTDDEKYNLLIGINDMLPSESIELVYLDYDDMCPKFIKDNINFIIKYDGYEWLEYHTANQNILNDPILNVALVVPAIIKGTMKSNDIDKELFKEMETASSTLIQLINLDANYFSSVLNQEKKEEDTREP